MWLNHFEFGVIWATFPPFWKIHFIFQHYGVFEQFLWFPIFRFLGIELRMKTQKSRKIFQILFCFCRFLAFVTDDLINLFLTAFLWFPWFPWSSWFLNFRSGHWDLLLKFVLKDDKKSDPVIWKFCVWKSLDLAWRYSKIADF